jgi:ABC-type proline/glycine betaine transport system permease subunit
MSLNPRPGGVPVDPDGHEDRLGFRLAHADRGGTDLRCIIGQGRVGWFIFENRNLLDIPAVFAGLLTVIVIGLMVENLIFRTIERNTIRKWGLHS